MRDRRASASGASAATEEEEDDKRDDDDDDDDDDRASTRDVVPEGSVEPAGTHGCHTRRSSSTPSTTPLPPLSDSGIGIGGGVGDDNDAAMAAALSRINGCPVDWRRF